MNARPTLIGVDLGDPCGDRTVTALVTQCPMCLRRRAVIEGMKAERWECSHVDCPHRARCTAGPSDKPPRYHP